MVDTVVQVEIRRGAYYDSVVLMGLQRALSTLPGVVEVGVVMGTAANKDVLAQSGLLTDEAQAAAADDLVIVMRADGEARAIEALAQVDPLLQRRRTDDAATNYRPKSMAAAAKMRPDAAWVLISVPGRYAADVAREALRLGKNVFLYSDNVPLEDEVALKQAAAEQGLLVMGPDCGTAMINGIGLGFANRVRRGTIGVIGASGTGLQHVTARIHQLGGGITHAFGTGGRDLSTQVNAIALRQSLDVLARDPATEVIVLISKPPAPEVAATILQAAQGVKQPIIINFIGYQPSQEYGDNIHFTHILDATAALAVQLATPMHATQDNSQFTIDNPQLIIQNFSGKYLRGLFSGGTLAYEAQLLLQEFLPTVYSNAPLDKRTKLTKATESFEHTIIDLGEDEFTVGRLHPMMDNELRIKRIRQEAADPETGLILLDVVLGDGAHPDPASELAPAIYDVITMARNAGRELVVLALVVGTDEDPQDLPHQVAQLQAAGAIVFYNHEEAIRTAGQLLTDRQQRNAQTTTAIGNSLTQSSGQPFTSSPIDLALLTKPLVAINVGLESFTESLTTQGAAVVHVDWRPPAGGNPRLAGILARMKSNS